MTSETVDHFTLLDIAQSKMLLCAENINRWLDVFKNKLHENLRPSVSDMRSWEAIIRAMEKFECYFKDVQTMLEREKDTFNCHMGMISREKIKQEFILSQSNLNTSPDCDGTHGFDRDKLISPDDRILSPNEFPDVGTPVEEKESPRIINVTGAQTHSWRDSSSGVKGQRDFDPKNTFEDDMNRVSHLKNSVDDGAIRVVVIGGGAGSEHELGLATAAAATKSLDPNRYKVTGLTILQGNGWASTEDGRKLTFLEAAAVMIEADVVLPLAYGRGGEDGPLATLATLIGVPFAGSPVVAAVTALNKWLTKLAASDCGLTVAPGVLLGAGKLHDVEAVATSIGPPPWFVKPVNGGSSIGVGRVDDRAGWSAALEAAFAVDDRVLVERMVVGREVSVAVLDRGVGGRLVGPPLEILSDGFFSTETKYNGSAKVVVPAPLDGDVVARLEAAALKMFDRLGCTGVSRFDFFVTVDGEIMMNEMETLPSLRAQSMVAQIFAKVGIEYSELITILVEGAMQRGSCGGIDNRVGVKEPRSSDSGSVGKDERTML